MEKEIPRIIDLENPKDNQEQMKLIQVLAPCIETLISRTFINGLNDKQQLDFRLDSFIWGYLNNLTYTHAKKFNISTTNKKVLLSSSLSLHSILFNNSVEISRLEYEAVKKSVDRNKSIKENFLEGAKAAMEDIPQIGEQKPHRSSLLPNLNKYLYEKYKEIDEK